MMISICTCHIHTIPGANYWQTKKQKETESDLLLLNFKMNNLKSWVGGCLVGWLVFFWREKKKYSVKCKIELNVFVFFLVNVLVTHTHTKVDVDFYDQQPTDNQSRKEKKNQAHFRTIEVFFFCFGQKKRKKISIQIWNFSQSGILKKK